MAAATGARMSADGRSTLEAIVRRFVRVVVRSFVRSWVSRFAGFWERRSWRGRGGRENVSGAWVVGWVSGGEKSRLYRFEGSCGSV